VCRPAVEREREVSKCIGGDQDTLFRIHGTNQPGWIGHAISSGCIRLTNEDVIDLYSRVQMGAIVVVLGPNQGASRIKSVGAQ
jgi:L,D-transpeptidase catalytic domain